MTPQELEEIADNTIMTWGRYKGRSYKDIPAGYFLHFNEQEYCNEYPGTKSYVVTNLIKLQERHKRETGRYYKAKVVIEPLVPPPPPPTSSPEPQTIEVTTRTLTPAEMATMVQAFGEDYDSSSEETQVVHRQPTPPPRVKAILQPIKEKVINVLIDDVRAIEL